MSMEWDHSLAVPVPPDRLWAALLDVQRAAPCLPGATVEEFDGDVIAGSLKIKVGPVSLTYKGTATFTQRDPRARVIVVEASGRETRGAGTGAATIRAVLEAEPGGQATKVSVHGSMNVTGRPAQFGRGVMAEVSRKLLEQFAQNLVQVLAPGAGTVTVAAVAPAPQAPARPIAPAGTSRQSALLKRTWERLQKWADEPATGTKSPPRTPNTPPPPVARPQGLELDHSFTVPVRPDRAWSTLLDVNRVTPCFPGATVDGFDGGVIAGHLRVKVGPVSLTYKGTATFTQQDPGAKVIVVEVSGKETRGAGTASAAIRAVLDAEPGGQATKVSVHTSLTVTGRPAQFGRGVMAEVGGKLVEQFGQNLTQLLASETGTGAAAAATTPSPPQAPRGPAASADVSGEIGHVERASSSAAAVSAPSASPSSEPAKRPAGQAGIFISYRRDDAPYPAGWLYERLANHFGQGQVFKDVDTIQPGDDFVEKITEAVAACDVLLAVIGSRWLTTTDGKGRRRLDDPADFVRIEIEAALERGVRVIPVLVDGASMPDPGELPTSLVKLTRRQALELSPHRFDTSRLLNVLNATLAPRHD